MALAPGNLARFNRDYISQAFYGSRQFRAGSLCSVIEIVEINDRTWILVSPHQSQETFLVPPHVLNDRGPAFVIESE